MSGLLFADKADSAPESDASKIARRREEFLTDVLRELARVRRAERKARRKGRRSRAKPNTRRLARKYGVSAEGYGFLDLALGHTLLGTFNADNPQVVARATLAALLEREKAPTENLQKTSILLDADGRAGDNAGERG